MPAIELIIDIQDGSNSDLPEWLKSQGIRCRPNYGVLNAPQPDASSLREMSLRPPPYVLATATAETLIEALRDYGTRHKKGIFIKRSRTGASVNATSWDASKLRAIECLDVVRLQRVTPSRSDVDQESELESSALALPV